MAVVELHVVTRIRFPRLVVMLGLLGLTRVAFALRLELAADEPRRVAG